MAYTVRRKPAKPERAHSAVVDRIRSNDRLAHAGEAVREGTAEVKEKLHEDLTRLSQLARFRRSVTLARMVRCLDCNGSGKSSCMACGGTGVTQVLLSEQTQPCEGCSGTGEVQCVECAGRGIVPNTHRKKIVWTLVIGVLAWGYVLFRLSGYDILPEQRARMFRGGGGGATGREPPARGTGAHGLGAIRPASPGSAGGAGTGNSGVVAPNRPGVPGGPGR